jgi:predicted MFS family arabinose efflux permease
MPPPSAGAFVVLVFCTGYYLSYCFRTITALIAPDLATELSLNARQLGLLGSIYFMAFASIQLPLGAALDRYGPRAVNGVLFSVAVAGAAIFALANNFYSAALGRALIGAGMAGALMAAFRGYASWYAPNKREMLSGVTMAVGGLGAMTVAVPAEMLMRAVGWRGAIGTLAVMAVAVTLLTWLGLPKQSAERNAKASDGDAASPQSSPTPAGGTVSATGYRQIITSPIFIAYAPLAFFGSGGLSAIQSLWAGPWLIDIAGLSRAHAAQVLFIFGAGLLVGYVIIGNLGSWLNRSPKWQLRFYVTGLLSAQGFLALITSNLLPHSAWPWFFYGATLGSSMLAYPALTKSFPAAVAGKVNGAYNQAMFIGVFVLQWGIGAVIQLGLDMGVAKIAAYQTAFAMVVALQFASTMWFMWRVRRGVPNG